MTRVTCSLLFYVIDIHGFAGHCQFPKMTRPQAGSALVGTLSARTILSGKLAISSPAFHHSDPKGFAETFDHMTRTSIAAMLTLNRLEIPQETPKSWIATAALASEPPPHNEYRVILK